VNPGRRVVAELCRASAVPAATNATSTRPSVNARVFPIRRTLEALDERKMSVRLESRLPGKHVLESVDELQPAGGFRLHLAGGSR
jgi:hypothetical protein